jgi:hypothetical protein
MNNLMTFEQFSVKDEKQVNEGLFTSLKTDIEKYLKNPKDEKKANSLISSAFAKTFNSKVTAHLKDEILDLSLEEKNNILEQSYNRLKDSKVGVLKLFKQQDGKFAVGGTGIVAHTGGGKDA